MNEFVILFTLGILILVGIDLWIYLSDRAANKH